MADDAIKIEVSGNVKADIAKKIRDIGTAALETDRALDILKASLNQFSAVAAFKSATGDVREFRNEVNRATQTQRTFAKSSQTVATELQGATKAATRYSSELKKVEAANDRVGKSTNMISAGIGRMFGLLASGFALQQYAQAQDAMTGIQNKIRSVTNSAQELAHVQERLLDIANRTRTGYEATTDGFVRFAKSMRDVPQDEVLRFVETLNKSLVAAGRTTGEVNSIVVQLGQALTSGRLQGDEFRSLSENLPYEALEAIAAALNTNVANLKALSTEGKITTEVLREAFANMAAGADAAFAKTIPTINQAITTMNNNFIAFTESSTAGAQLVAAAITWIGENLNIVIPILAAFAAAWAAVQLVTIITQFVALTATIVGFAAAMIAANLPLIVFVGTVALAIAGVIGLAWAVAKLTGNEKEFEKSLADGLGKIGEMIKGVFNFEGAMTDLTAANDNAKKGLDLMTGSSNSAANALAQATKATNDNKAAVNAWSKDVVKGVNAVSKAYQRLTTQAKAALAVANAGHYKDLVAAGGTSGSFTAVGSPSSSSPTSNGPTLTTPGVPASKGPSSSTSSANDNSGGSSNRGNGNGPTITNITMNVSTPDANSFSRSRNQTASDIAAAMG